MLRGAQRLVQSIERKHDFAEIDASVNIVRRGHTFGHGSAILVRRNGEREFVRDVAWGQAFGAAQMLHARHAHRRIARSVRVLESQPLLASLDSHGKRARAIIDSFDGERDLLGRCGNATIGEPVSLLVRNARNSPGYNAPVVCLLRGRALRDQLVQFRRIEIQRAERNRAVGRIRRRKHVAARRFTVGIPHAKGELAFNQRAAAQGFRRIHINASRSGIAVRERNLCRIGGWAITRLVGIRRSIGTAGNRRGRRKRRRSGIITHGNRHRTNNLIEGVSVARVAKLGNGIRERFARVELCEFHIAAYRHARRLTILGSRHIEHLAVHGQTKHRSRRLVMRHNLNLELTLGHVAAVQSLRQRQPASSRVAEARFVLIHECAVLGRGRSNQVALAVVGHRHINLRDIRAVLDASLRGVGHNLAHGIDERLARDCAAIDDHIVRREPNATEVKRHRLAIFGARRPNSRSRAAGRHGSALRFGRNFKREAIVFGPIAALKNLVQAKVRCRKAHIGWFVGIGESHRRSAAFDQLAVDMRRHIKAYAVLQAYNDFQRIARASVGHASKLGIVARNNLAHDELKRLARVGLRKLDAVNRLHDVGHACGAIIRVAELKHAIGVFVNAIEQRLRGVIGPFDAEGELARMHRATIERLLHRKAAKAAVGLFLGIHVGKGIPTIVRNLGMQSARMVVGHLNRYRAFMGVERDVARLCSFGIQRLAAVSVLDHLERIRARFVKRQLTEVETLRPAIRQAAYRCLLRKIGAERVGRGLVSRHQAEPEALSFGHRTTLELLCARNRGHSGFGAVAVFECERLRVAQNSFRIGRGTLLRVRNAQLDMGIGSLAHAFNRDSRLPHCRVIRHARQTLASGQVFHIDPRIAVLHHFNNFVDIRLTFRVTQVAQVECRLRERDASTRRNRRHHTAVVNAGGFARHCLDAISLGQRR